MAPLPPHVRLPEHARAPESAVSRASTEPTAASAPAAQEPLPPSTRDRAAGWVRRWGVATAALLLALAAILLPWWRMKDAPAALTARDAATIAATQASKALEQQRRAPSDASTAYQRILPSLVVIQTGAANGERAVGTGVVVSDAGLIVTAHHVVAGAGEIRVRFADGTSATATVTTAKSETDIAVLTPAQLPQVVVAATLGGGVTVGQQVYAVGNPLGLTASLSQGVVSATGRRIEAAGRTLENLIQFDAAVNPGNSGGPLLDRDGRVVGIVTALANPSAQPFFVGIGFAVPIATAGGAAGGPSI